MRLLYISHSFPPPDRPLTNVGGMQRVATELEAALAKHPEVALSSLVMRSSWRWTGVKIVPFLLGALGRLGQRAARREVDAVLFSSMVTAPLAVPLQRLLRRQGIKTAAIAHGQDVTLPVSLYQRFLPRVFGVLDALHPVSRATGAAAVARGLPAQKLRVVPNGLDLSRFDAPAKRRPGPRSLPESLHVEALPEGALLLCSVGRQVPRKGFAWFVEAVMPLLPENVHYWLAGDGPEAAKIAAAAARHGLDLRVRLPGRISDDALQALYQSADLFIMPNVAVPGDMEGFGVVMLEAGCCGLPTIASRLEGILDVIEEGANGRLVESGNARAFAEAIMPFYRDRSLLEEAGRQARRHVVERFAWPAVADQHVQALRALLLSD